MDFDAEFWRAQVTTASGIELALWCAVASDGVWHPDGKKLKGSGLEYAQGSSRQHWLGSLSKFVGHAEIKAHDITRIFNNERNEQMLGPICRWDPTCERNHAMRATAPTGDPQSQDQTINALAAIGFSSCPSAPGEHGLLTPLVIGRDNLAWPLWTDPLRIADLEAALCCGWPWPTIASRRWYSGRLLCFARGELRETESVTYST